MRLVRIALAPVNTTVGAQKSNVDKAIEATRDAHRDGATVVLLPEQLIGGYPAEDLVQWRAFVDRQERELLRFAAATAELDCVVALGVNVARGAQLYNAAALVYRGTVVGIVPKEKLPLYNVFYEERTLTRGTPGLDATVFDDVPFGDLVFEFDFGTLAIEVCEDLWSPDGPLRRRSFAGAELVLNLSASPFRVGIAQTRREMIHTRAADNQCTLAYVNLVGANDGLIFDGGGLVSQNGRSVLEAPRFTDGVFSVTVDLERTRRLRTENTTFRADQLRFEAGGSPRVRLVSVDTEGPDRSRLRYPAPPHGSYFLPPPATATPDPRRAFCEELLDALALGVGDYFEKTGAFRTIGVSLSGGRDSYLCLYIARRYIERRFAALPAAERKVRARAILRAFFMPSRHSSSETRAAAKAAADELDATFSVIAIDDAYAREAAEVASMLAPGESLTPLARQNIQARVRALRMWTWANSDGGLFLQTSNMSEKAVGYTTIGGDMEGALSVIANVPKTVVNYLLDYLLETEHSDAIRLTLAKPASAELADDQEDERDLMPFPVLDACFALYAGEKMAIDEVAAVLVEMFPHYDAAALRAWALKFGRLFNASIYKWVQTPLALHVGNLDLDRERALQLPVVQKSEWQSEP